jgi:hypothetical protein
MSIDERLANPIKKGSVTNIKVLPEERKTIPKLVLSRITVSDMLDENGLSMGDTIGNKKAYAVVTLNALQRDRLYAAMQDGRPMYELYCDLTQPKEEEDYAIPPEFFDESDPTRNMEQRTNSNVKTDGGEY